MWRVLGGNLAKPRRGRFSGFSGQRTEPDRPVFPVPGLSAHMGVMKNENGHLPMQQAIVAGGAVRLLQPGEALDGGKELSLGSQDLIRFAAYAARQGWPHVAFELADELLDPLAPERQDETSRQMLSLLTRYGVAELHAAMQDEFDCLYVVGVEVSGGPAGATVKLRRRGHVLASDLEAAGSLISSAWQDLHLS